MDELKDLVLSTLKELEENQDKAKSENFTAQTKLKPSAIKDNVDELNKQIKKVQELQKEVRHTSSEEKSAKKDQIPQTLDQKAYLEGIKERVLVLFEGLQTPESQNLDIKLDITLNFLEYLLSSLSQRISELS